MQSDHFTVHVQDPDSSPPVQSTAETHFKRFRNKQDEQEQEEEEEAVRDLTAGRQQKRRRREFSDLEILVPAVRISRLPELEYSGEEFETPKGSDLKRDSEVQVEVEIPRIRCCPPPAPKKPRAAPATKRRAVWVQSSVILLDVSREVESMFPPPVLQDFGKKIKKARS